MIDGEFYSLNIITDWKDFLILFPFPSNDFINP